MKLPKSFLINTWIRCRVQSNINIFITGVPVYNHDADWMVLGWIILHHYHGLASKLERAFSTLFNQLK